MTRMFEMSEMPQLVVEKIHRLRQITRIQNRNKTECQNTVRNNLCNLRNLWIVSSCLCG